MTNFQKFFKHLHLVNTHRRYVRKMCFKMGIPWRGLVHDLSKYSIKEFSIYKFYNGKQSPHEIARKELGYSPSWLFHKAKNKHHWEYWLDNNGDSNFLPVISSMNARGGVDWVSGGGTFSYSPNISYNSSTGILTANANTSYQYYSNDLVLTVSISCYLYLIY